MKNDTPSIVYWDASAVLSALFKDSQSEEAIKWSQKKGIHLISTLAYAEVCAVIIRLKKERILADVLVRAAFEALEQGPWRYLNVLPDWEQIKVLSQKRSLRGADLWHLAVGKILQGQIPELEILTFDKKLRAAVKKEHLSS